MVTYNELMKWKPALLDQAADELLKHKRTLVNQQDELDAGKVPDTWEGDGAVAATGRHQRLVNSLNDIVAPVSEVVAALDENGPKIKTAKETAQANHDEAIGLGYKVTGLGTTVVKVTPDKNNDAHDQATADRYATNIATALSDAATAEGNINWALSQSSGGSYDGGTGTLAQASLPEELRGLSNRELARQLVEHPEWYGGLDRLLTQEQQQALGEEVATTATDARNQIPPDTDALSDLNAALEAYGDNHVVATSFLNKITPEGLVDLSNYIATAQLDQSQVGIHSDFDPDLAQAVKDLQNSLGLTLASGTADWTPETRYGSDPGSASNVSEAWYEELMAAGETDLEYGSGETYGFQVLAPLLANDQYSPEFLSHIGQRMVIFEKAYASEHHGAYPWFGEGGGNRQGERLDWSQGWDDTKDTAGRDPLTGLMRGLELNPEAARDFFTSTTTYSDLDGDGSVETDADMVRYLLHDRAWMNDMPPGIITDDDGYAVDDAPVSLTGIDELGDALCTGAIDPGADERSVTIAETIVNSTYDHMPTDNKDEIFSKENILNPNVRGDIARIMGAYMPSVHLAFDQPDYNGDFTPNSVFDDARFARATSEGGYSALPVELMLAEIGKDAEGRETLAAANEIATAANLDRAYARGGIDGIGDISRYGDDPIAVGARVQGAIDFGASTDVHETSLSADEAHNARVDAAVDLGSMIVGKATENLPLAGSVIDLISGGLKEGLHDDHIAQVNADIGTMLSGNEESFKDMAKQAVWQHMPDSQRPTWVDNAGNTHVLGKNVDINSLPPNSPQMKAYENWIETNDWGQELKDLTDDNSAGTWYNDGFDETQRHLEEYR